MNPKDIVLKFWEAMGGNDFFVVAELLHEDFILE